MIYTAKEWMDKFSNASFEEVSAYGLYYYDHRDEVIAYLNKTVDQSSNNQSSIIPKEK